MIRHITLCIQLICFRIRSVDVGVGLFEGIFVDNLVGNFDGILVGAGVGI